MGAGVVLTSPFGDISYFSFHIEFDGSNNVVGYEALLHVLDLAKDCGIKLLKPIGDSYLIVIQFKETISCKNEILKRYRDVV